MQSASKTKEPVGITCQILRDQTPDPKDPKQRKLLKTKAGDYGVIYERSSGQVNVSLYRRDPPVNGWIATRYVKEGVPQDKPVTFVTLNPENKAMDITKVASNSNSKIGKVLSAVLLSLRNFERHDRLKTEDVVFLRSDDRILTLANRAIQEMPSDVEAVLSNPQSTIEDFSRLTQAQTNDHGDATYLIFYQHDSKGLGFYVGTTEQAFFLIFGTYDEHLLTLQDEPSEEDALHQEYYHRADAIEFHSNAQSAFESLGWVPICSRLGAKGLNYNSPMTESLQHGEKPIWVKMSVPEHNMLIFRRPIMKIVNDFLPFSGQMFSFLAPTQVRKLDVTHAYFSVEVMTNNQPHPSPYARLESVGPYSNWLKTHELGMAIQYQRPDNGTWEKVYYQMRQNFNKSTEHCARVGYEKAMMVYTQVMQIEWINPPAFMNTIVTAQALRIKELSFDVLNRVITVQNSPMSKPKPSPTLRSRADITAELAAAGLRIANSFPSREEPRRYRCDLPPVNNTYYTTYPLQINEFGGYGGESDDGGEELREALQRTQGGDYDEAAGDVVQPFTDCGTGEIFKLERGFRSILALEVSALQLYMSRSCPNQVHATAATSEQRDFPANSFGLDPAQIYSSRNSSFLEGVLESTAGRGVDVVLNSLTGDLLQDSWTACAEFGRFIEVGKKDLLDAGNLCMKPFLIATTFTAFDLTSLYYSSEMSLRKLWSSLMSNVLELYRSDQIPEIQPLEVYDISQIEHAFRRFRTRSRMGKIAISIENPDTQIKVLPSRHNTQFPRDLTYLLIGCLGGLGGSIAKWMVSRGANKLVFLGRSGRERPAARRLVDDLEAMGATVTVVKGDVVNFSDVQRSLDCIPGILGGVVQAAMGLDVSLQTTPCLYNKLIYCEIGGTFTSMSEASWHKSIDPKLRGTWNIHNAISKREADRRLDFFLMTSSISGSVGTATESNYCSATSFLDAFARFRRSHGLRATSLGLGMISEVGYLHENPEIEDLLLRKGIQAINQEEFLQILDLALSHEESSTAEFYFDPLAASHILTGLEPHGLGRLRDLGFEVDNLALEDPRASLLVSAAGGNKHTSEVSRLNNSSHSTELTSALRKCDGSLQNAIHDLTAKRFSNLTLMPLANVDMEKHLAAYGMDSMLAAEFRTWIFRVFKIDVPFLELMSATVSLAALVENIKTKIKALAE
ncbi:hypothetical protein G7Y79_00004g014800 [Physcia stellaris]|nr:hypothetical protein G7Y79_00004g014800 [Physcia stellaris]